MKWLLFLLSLLMSFSSFAISHKEFVKLPRESREKIMLAYRSFIGEYQKTIELSSVRKMNFPEFIQSAYAADYDCIYGGWPSNRINGLCSLPRSNPAFQRESCGAQQMPCQPLLFGRGVCVPSATRQQRNSSFANCQRQSSSMGRSIADVVEYISDPELSTEADELFRLVDEICTSGAQATTGMCRILKDRVASIKSERTPVEETRANVEDQSPEDALLLATQNASSVEQLIQNLNTTTTCIACEALREQTTDEPEKAPVITPPLQPEEHLVVEQPRLPEESAQIAPEEAPQPQTDGRIPFPRIESGYDLATCGGTRGNPLGYEEKYLFNCSGGSERIPAGMAFRPGEGHPYMNVETRYPGGSKPGRFWEIDSRNQALNETYLMMEEYGGGPDSHNVKSFMFLLPRVTVPSVRAEGNNLIATLPTGETVTMDKTSKAITSGALTEGPIDLNTDRFQRRPPNINYTGSGISIRLDHRYEHPLTGSTTATVKQGSKTCTIQRTAILDEEGKLRTTSDAAFLAVINQNCRGGGFTLP